MLNHNYILNEQIWNYSIYNFKYIIKHTYRKDYLYDIRYLGKAELKSKIKKYCFFEYLVSTLNNCIPGYWNNLLWLCLNHLYIIL